MRIAKTRCAFFNKVRFEDALYLDGSGRNRHHRPNDSITRSIAGRWRFFTFIQCFDRPGLIRGITALAHEPFEPHLARGAK
jgi:hypothetical protein